MIIAKKAAQASGSAESTASENAVDTPSEPAAPVSKKRAPKKRKRDTSTNGAAAAADDEDETEQRSKVRRTSGRDEEFYIPHRPEDVYSEQGYADHPHPRHHLSKSISDRVY